jgi:hypothetical protein
LKKKGQYEQAKPLYLDALKIVEEVYGEEHVLVAEISNNLADVYRKIALVDQATGTTLSMERHELSLLLDRQGQPLTRLCTHARTHAHAQICICVRQGSTKRTWAASTRSWLRTSTRWAWSSRSGTDVTSHPPRRSG